MGTEFRIIDKSFSKGDNLFHIIKENKSTFSTSEKTYISFSGFYKALNKDLSNANLLDYDFDGIDLSEYDFHDAKISSDIMIKAGIYRSNLFNIISRDRELATITLSNSLDLVQTRQSNLVTFDNNDFVLYYISDLHLNHKLLDTFKTKVNKFELDAYFTKILNQLKESLLEYPVFHDSIVFIGDISYNFNVFKIFFRVYRQIFPYSQTFVILGNHELWDQKLNKDCHSVEEMIEKYRNFLSSFEYKIHLLENELYLPNDDQRFYTQEKIMAMDNETLRNKFLRNSYAIFGGIGYAGQNEKFNANQNIYRTLLINREEEQKRSRMTATLHQKLTQVAADKSVFFITHMPKNDWSTDEYNKNWFYLSGHTHQNIYTENENQKVYADNQVGYAGNSFGFKFLSTSREYNIFQDFPDGIHEITRKQYLIFNYGMGIRIKFNRHFEKLFMLKRDGIYCFLLQPTNTKSLKLLDGGNTRNVGDYDINFFYEHLAKYTASVKLFLEPYNKYQEQIAYEIKRIGGNGNIHGGIVDISFFNHLFVNPITGAITPYFAYSIEDKYVYPNLISLLKQQDEKLYNNYIKLLSCNEPKNNLIIFNKNLQESDKKTYTRETDIYKISKALKSFQYMNKKNIVRVWNPTVIPDGTKESGQLIVSGIINPEEMKRIEAEQKQIKKQQRLLEMSQQKQLAKHQLSAEEKKKIQFDKYCKKISHLNTNIVVLSYTGARNKAKYKCLHCNHEWACRNDHFLHRYKCSCPKCHR